MRHVRTAVFCSFAALFGAAGCFGSIGEDGSSGDQPGDFVGSGAGGATTSSGLGGSISSGEGGTPTDPPPDDPPPDDPPGEGGAGGGTQQPVDCSGIAQHPNFELCDSSPTHCAGVFTNGAGCSAFCAAAGLQCTAAFGGEPGCQKESGSLSCGTTGHQSDWCECGPSNAPPSNCPTDPNNPPAQVDQHYNQASFNPRSSWVLTCQSYAYTAQFAEHEACDNLYQAGSGKGTATFVVTVNPGQYDVYIEGRHTENRNPAGMRVEVNNGTASYVTFINQKDNSGAIKMDLHGTYCLDGQVEIIIDSSMSGASDSVKSVRLQPS